MIEAKSVKAKIASQVIQVIKTKQVKADHKSSDDKRFDDYFKRCQSVLNGLSLWKSAVDDEAFIKALNKMKESDKSLNRLSSHMLEAFLESNIEKTLQYFKEIQASSLSSITNTEGLVRRVFASIFNIISWNSFSTILNSAISEVIESVETYRKLEGKSTSIEHGKEKISQSHIDRSAMFSLLGWTSLIGHDVAYLQVKGYPQTYRIIRCRSHFGGIVELLFIGHPVVLKRINYAQLRDELRTKVNHSYYFTDSNGRKIADESDLVMRWKDDNLFDCYLQFFVPFLENNKENQIVLTNTYSHKNSFIKTFFLNDPDFLTYYVSADVFGKDSITNCVAYAISRLSNSEPTDSHITSLKQYLSSENSNDEQRTDILDFGKHHSSKLSTSETISLLTGDVCHSMYDCSIVVIEHIASSFDLHTLLGNEWQLDGRHYVLAVKLDDCLIYEQAVTVNSD